MRYVHRRAQIAVDRLDLGKGERVIERRQARLGEALRDKGEHGRGLCQGASVGNHRRHAALGIDGEIFGATPLVIWRS